MRCERGATMIELLCVLAIIFVLATVALPGYANYLTKARRAEGQVALLEALQQQERYFSEHNRFLAYSASEPAPTQTHFRWWSGSRAGASAYELQAQACAGLELTQCVELRATPGTERVDASFRDPDCGTLSLRSTGEHKASGTNTQHCWP
ncbi:MAG: type IV pilin protein [Pseudomonadota bacterium]